jgi:hypothetical protein
VLTTTLRARLTMQTSLASARMQLNKNATLQVLKSATPSHADIKWRRIKKTSMIELLMVEDPSVQGGKNPIQHAQVEREQENERDNYGGC